MFGIQRLQTVSMSSPEVPPSSPPHIPFKDTYSSIANNVNNVFLRILQKQ